MKNCSLAPNFLIALIVILIIIGAANILKKKDNYYAVIRPLKKINQTLE